MVSVLFVCLGNICRSPTADGIFRQMVEEAGLAGQVTIDSAGTGDWHIGHSPDARTAEKARERGYDLSKLRARQVCSDDYPTFDYILAMDEQNLADMQRQCPPEHQRKLGLFLDYAEGAEVRAVPDPYYGGPEGFDRVLDLVEAGCRGLLAHLQADLACPMTVKPEKIQEQVSLAQLNSFGFAVSARYFMRAETVADIRQALTFAEQQTLPLLILGGGSNLVFSDDYPGLVLQLCLSGIETLDEQPEYALVKVAAGENWHELVGWTLQQGYYGLENLSLIPGSVGAAPIQNIGAYGVELESVFDSLEAIDRATGEQVTLTAADCAFGYRDSLFKNAGKDRYVITTVTFKLTKQPSLVTGYGAITDELSRMGVTQPEPQAVADAVCRIRRSKLPDPNELGNAGSFFKNPVVSQQQYDGLAARFPDLVSYPQADGKVKLAAGWLIDQLGWKGKRSGPVGVHEQQALVLVNYGGGNGREILALAQQISDSVQTAYGITLEIEPGVV